MLLLSGNTDAVSVDHGNACESSKSNNWFSPDASLWFYIALLRYDATEITAVEHANIPVDWQRQVPVVG
jgi:hypothetical protein